SRIHSTLRIARRWQIVEFGALAEKAKALGSALVREAVEAWLAYLSTERQLAAKTSEAYERDIGQFLTFLAWQFNRLPDMNRLLALSARGLRAFLAAPRGQGLGGRGLAPPPPAP